MDIHSQIKALEQTFCCRLCIKDHVQALSSVIEQEYRMHLNPFCTFVKRKEDYKYQRCLNCDLENLQQALLKHRQPLIKYCHTQVAEIVIPLFEGDQLTGTIYAGPFRFDPDQLADIYILSQPPFSRLTRPERMEQLKLPLLDQDMAHNLIQIVSLLGEHIILKARSSAEYHYKSGSRRDQIVQFLENNYMKLIGLPDVAEHVGLSCSRLTQVIKELFNITFPALCNSIRIKHACTMLARSHLTASQIAQASGFSNQAYFHKVFKGAMGMTPLAYRQANMQVQVP